MNRRGLHMAVPAILFASGCALTAAGRKKAAGKLGAGGPAIELRTRNGSITVVQR